MKTIKVKTYHDIPQNYTGIVVYSDGEKVWYLNGLLHREEGPCTECKDCQSDNFEPASGSPEVSPMEKSLAKPKTCSKPGPAIVWASGGKQWFLNGKLHREDGPAVVYADGEKEWHLNGDFVSKQTVELFYMLKHKKVLDL
jgi:hypothetical protein